MEEGENGLLICDGKHFWQDEWVVARKTFWFFFFLFPMKVGLGHIDSSWGKSQSAALCDNSPRTSFRGKICSQVEP